MIDMLPFWWDITPKDLDKLDPKFMGKDISDALQAKGYVFQGPFVVSYSKGKFPFDTPWVMLKAFANSSGEYVITWEDGDKVYRDAVAGSPKIRNGSLVFTSKSGEKGDIQFRPIKRSDLPSFTKMFGKNNTKSMKAFLAMVKEIVDFE